VVAIESSGSYRGRYFVLMGHLSPLDGIGPEQLGVRELEAILAQGEVRELILATNSTVEGEATAHFLGELAARRGIRASRNRPRRAGRGELEYVDGGTLRTRRRAPVGELAPALRPARRTQLLAQPAQPP